MFVAAPVSSRHLLLPAVTSRPQCFVSSRSTHTCLQIEACAHSHVRVGLGCLKSLQGTTLRCYNFTSIFQTCSFACPFVKTWTWGRKIDDQVVMASEDDRPRPANTSPSGNIDPQRLNAFESSLSAVHLSTSLAWLRLPYHKLKHELQTCSVFEKVAWRSSRQASLPRSMVRGHTVTPASQVQRRKSRF